MSLQGMASDMWTIPHLLSLELLMVLQTWLAAMPPRQDTWTMRTGNTIRTAMCNPRKSGNILFSTSQKKSAVETAGLGGYQKRTEDV